MSIKSLRRKVGEMSINEYEKRRNMEREEEMNENEGEKR